MEPAAATKKQILTLKEQLNFVAGKSWCTEDFLKWTPDVFAACASTLESTGTYTAIVDVWPPDSSKIDSWLSDQRAIALQWRQAMCGGGAVPARVVEAWKEIIGKGSKSLTTVRGDRSLLTALLELACLADEASENFGLPNPRDPAEEKAARLLTSAEAKVTPASLCERVHSSRIQVLPKQHTPQAGICLRSLSHHLALVHPRGIAPRWFRVPTPIIGNEDTSLNVLCVPWPFEIPTSAFQAASPSFGTLPLMSPAFGFFEYQPPDSSDVGETVLELLDAAEKAGKGPVHIIVLPELAVSRPDYEDLREQLGDRNVMLISGICEPGTAGRPSRNIVRCDFIGTAVGTEQVKHHRWQLEKNQICRYKLDLDQKQRWWEHSVVSDRQLSFITIAPQVTLCVLICEDLARQDPAPDMIRAVGPNLVIALLLDGPQLEWRWPARYAAVLAEDPGSTVITLTSLGMALRSNSEGEQSRAVLMYRDPDSVKPFPKELPSNNRALLLRFRIDTREEWSADGRSDGGATGHLTLQECWPVA